MYEYDKIIIIFYKKLFAHTFFKKQGWIKLFKTKIGLKQNHKWNLWLKIKDTSQFIYNIRKKWHLKWMNIKDDMK